MKTKGRKICFCSFFLFVFVFPRRKMVAKMLYPAERSDKWRSEKMPNGLGKQPCNNLRQNQSAER